MSHAGTCIAVVCVLAVVCSAAASGEDEMMPGIRTNSMTSLVRDRRRRPSHSGARGRSPAMPANFSFLRRSWQHEDAHHVNHVATAGSENFSGAMLRNDDRLNEVSPVVFPGDVVGRGGEVELEPRGDEVSSLMMDKNFDEMTMDDQLRMSDVNSVEEFARMLGVPLPPTRGYTVAASTASDSNIAARFGGPTHDGLPVAQQANCLPENMTVPLKIAPELNVVFYPTCVRLQRCGGCCGGPLLKCRPVDVRPVKLKILRVEQKEVEPQGRSAMAPLDIPASSSDRRRRPKPEGSRRRRETTSKYVIVEEEEHLNCSCQCRVQASDCNPDTHHYLANECRCACKNQDEKDKCEQRSDSHYWHKEDCMCYCYHEETCSTGQIFDHNSCSCKSADIRFRSGLSVRRGTELPPPVSFPSS